MSPIMPQLDGVPFAPQPQAPGKPSFFRKLLGRQSRSVSSSPAPPDSGDELPKSIDDLSKSIIRRMSRKVVPSLPRPQTFKRQQSEKREYLTPIEPTADERRATSVDRRSHRTCGRPVSQVHSNPRASAPSFIGESRPEAVSLPILSHPLPILTIDDDDEEDQEDEDQEFSQEDEPDALHLDRHIYDHQALDEDSTADVRSMTTSEYEKMIHDDLETLWILNLSMHFRDRSKREKFFVTYREQDHVWRRVTVSLDYRDAPLNSLEYDLLQTKYQRDKSAKVYEAIRESLQDIQFYDTVTNLKLETTDGRLHVHVVEDGNEIIHYPTVSQILHLGCKRIRERDIEFDSHMSGFVYKVNVKGQVLIKKEIPSPDTIEEFLYEVNALSSLRFSKNVIQFHGVVVDDFDEHVKGLLISYADQGALIDVIYENCKDNDIGLPWSTREKWARQIVQGLSDIHESGFVQGDFTLSNIVIDDAGDAKIIDINRRGCPVGWEPPEATALIESNHRLSMYIGVKSDLYQLGMVLWGLAMMEDEPEAQGRPLMLGPEINVPDWYRQMTEICLSDDPRLRLQASALLQMFPQVNNGNNVGTTRGDHEPMSVDDGSTLHDFVVDGYNAHSHPVIRTVEPPPGWPHSNTAYVDNGPLTYDPYYYTRGRSPPSPLPSNYDGCDSERESFYKSAWAANRNIPSSYSDSGDEDIDLDNEDDISREPTPTPTADKLQVVDADDGDFDEQAQSYHKFPVLATNAAVGASETEQTAEVDHANVGEMELQANDGMHAVDIRSTNLDNSKKPNTVKFGQQERQAVKRPAGIEAKLSKGEREARSISLQRPRVVEMVSIEPRSGNKGDKISMQEQESETEPEYTTSHARGITAPDAQESRSSAKLPSAKLTGKVDSRDTETRLKDAAVKDYTAAIQNSSSQEHERPRQTAHPVTLTGIGAAHVGIDEHLLQEKGSIEDDFRLMTRPEVPAIMITTEANA
ncbi:hypothetical protein PT974_01058 [Cladobotryum mycophilum]|uniref:Protein kinase domain-containing protein n=1 Tax=Cladobotryum mycophilum TaxID=491253 RepID=A0ABR0T3W1_9HYPO